VGALRGKRVRSLVDRGIRHGATGTDVADRTARHVAGGRAARPRRPLSASCAATVVAVVTVLAASPVGAAPGLAPHERATAVASRTTVYLEATYRGHLTYRQDNALRREAVVVRRRCSGIVVNPDGYVVTAADCVRPAPTDLLVDALHTLGRSLAGRNQLAAERMDDFASAVMPTAVFSGSRAGDPPSVTLHGQFGVVDPNHGSASGTPATVVSSGSPGENALALVRLQRPNLPAIELSPATPPNRGGDDLVVLSYRPRPGNAASTEYAVRAVPAAVTGRDGQDRLRLAGDLGIEDRGGAVVDAWGRLVAVLDAAPAVDGGPTASAVHAAHVAEFLASAGVTNRVSEVDLAYREALRDYFAGRFSAAWRRFDSIVRDAPSHSWARTYRDRAWERLTVDGDAVENSGTWVRYLLSAVAGVLLVALVEKVRRRRWPLRLTRLRAVTAGTTGEGPPGGGPARNGEVVPGDNRTGSTDGDPPPVVAPPASQPE